MTDNQQAITIALPALLAKAIHADLPITARAIHNAVKALGWELAGDTEKAASYAPNMESVRKS